MMRKRFNGTSAHHYRGKYETEHHGAEPEK
jgi:hypothetical protein